MNIVIHKLPLIGDASFRVMEFTHYASFFSSLEFRAPKKFGLPHLGSGKGQREDTENDGWDDDQSDLCHLGGTAEKTRS